MTALAVRPAGPDDVEAVRSLIAGMGGHDEVVAAPGFAAAYLEVLRSPGCVALVAEVDGAVSGYAEVHRRASTLHATVEAWLAALAVAAGARRAGVGRGLVEAVEEAARGMGCTELVLESSSSRVAARHFYLGLGFADQPEAFRYRKSLAGTPFS